tara:strand:+ start:276 stop:449 length:174 start_codon:yes stop_codon:yes gene_type:complete
LKDSRGRSAVASLPDADLRYLAAEVVGVDWDWTTPRLDATKPRDAKGEGKGIIRLSV